MKWIDATQYRQNEQRGETAPRSWRLPFTFGAIVVTRHINYEPDQWLICIHQLGIDQLAESTDLEEAKAEAVEIAADRLSRAMAELGKVPSLKQR